MTVGVGWLFGPYFGLDEKAILVFFLDFLSIFAFIFYYIFSFTSSSSDNYSLCSSSACSY